MDHPISVLILGAGTMAKRIAHMLREDPRFDVVLASRDSDALIAAGGFSCLPPLSGNLREAIDGALRGRCAVISVEPTLDPQEVAQAAISAGCHYLDIAESAVSNEAVGALGHHAQEAGVVLAPGCGLAPGYVTGLAAKVLETAGLHEEITVFVGDLPAVPENRLGYANIWGIEGLTSEYTLPCLALKDAQLVEVAPLSDLETVHLNGTEFEAFTTAGSLDALARTHAGRVGGLLFKTLRFPGHLDFIRFLLDDLALSKRLYLFRSLLTTALPRTEDDRIVIAIRRRSRATETWDVWFLNSVKDNTGGQISAISTATASHVCATLDVILLGGTDTGFIAPGKLLPDALRKSPFFCHLDQEGITLHAS